MVSADAAAAVALDTAAPADGPSRTNQLEDEGEPGQSLREAEEQEFGRTRAEEVEKEARDRDLARISMLDVQTRREIAHMDMMGEYGSKVSLCVLKNRYGELTNRLTFSSNIYSTIRLVSPILDMSSSPIGLIV